MIEDTTIATTAIRHLTARCLAAEIFTMTILAIEETILLEKNSSIDRTTELRYSETIMIDSARSMVVTLSYRLLSHEISKTQKPAELMNC